MLEDATQIVNATYVSYEGGSKDHIVSGFENNGNATHPGFSVSETHSLQDGSFIGGSGSNKNYSTSMWTSEGNETDPHVSYGRTVSDKESTYSHHSDSLSDNSTTVWAQQDLGSSTFGEKSSLSNNTVSTYSDAGMEESTKQWNSKYADGTDIVGETTSEANTTATVDKSSLTESGVSKWTGQYVNGSSSVGQEIRTMVEDNVSGSSMQKKNTSSVWTGTDAQGGVTNGVSTNTGHANETHFKDTASENVALEAVTINKDGTMTKRKEEHIKDGMDTLKTSENTEKSGSNWVKRGQDGSTSSGYSFSNKKSFLNTKMGSFRQNSTNKLQMVQPMGMETPFPTVNIGGAKVAPIQRVSGPSPFSDGFGRNFTQSVGGPPTDSFRSPFLNDRIGMKNAFPLQPGAFFPRPPGRPQYSGPPGIHLAFPFG